MKNKKKILALTATGLGGAVRRAAMTLAAATTERAAMTLLTLVMAFAVQTAWADGLSGSGTVASQPVSHYLEDGLGYVCVCREQRHDV